ncbi:hypothetical protein TNCV_3100351 [Trichonephila clavipes]|nr:hypothetical protein TNCV_3100351 [Trichonephila clavipes]
MRRNTAFCHKLSLVTKHEVTILNPKASVKASSGNVRLHHLQRNQRPCTPVLVNKFYDISEYRHLSRYEQEILGHQYEDFVTKCTIETDDEETNCT